ncbi:formin-binding protein 4 [Tribolium castaneum]|uniref:formin-binding protein 4 n=1 Tax=Tribolium castaneum TaxID=7070 RepID=UPI00046C1813|nr:PREDICTED: formin-binding protein 4 [Tribolium castaneum]|eukprot:XP_008199606.1 PREDICTED: formin-binding protein 4 [Tribolium castaneum]
MKMDARVNDFLNEIDEIAPLSENKEDCAWEKCYDEESGYYYYWNTKTNEVTWDMPAEYKSLNKTKSKKTCNLYIPPRTAPLFPSTRNLLPPVSDAIKIYKIGECAGSSTKSEKVVKGEEHKVKEEKKTVVKTKPVRKHSDSDDEKIVLISSYSGDSESEEEKEEANTKKLINGSKPLLTSEDNDEVTKQKTSTEPTSKASIVPKKPENKEISGFSLVAGYSDSDEEQEESNHKPNFLIGPPPQENKVSHSTLFPATKPIDVKDFAESPKIIGEGDEGFDSKAFQRKRRIGVALINTGKKTVIDDDNERKGLGFSNDSNSGENSSSPYPGFKSGGVMFVKADVLNPTSTEEKAEDCSLIEETYTTLKEKLGFLSEGREEVSPVQVMLIQVETLYIALKSGNLKHTYLKQWLDEKCSELIKLEKEATPEGWLLQWDRSHKRYFYQNASTGESQWEYPQADVTVCDEAMDICTTPPPTEPTIHMSPPLPPVIASPSPPPPPSISDCKTSKKKKCDIPLPPEPKKDVSSERYASNGEPFPPGVDASDVTTKTKDIKGNDMTDVLNSFYSDIAAIETSNSPPVSNVNEDTKLESTVDNVQEPMKKKKKTKVKLAQGIAMKKKGVSKLVEKWKNVQLSYND